MTCNKAQSMIMPFINNKLRLKELEEFVDHIGTCPACKEELEVYYALLTAMKQLDEDKNLSSDFGLELNQKLDRIRDRIFHAKFTYYRKKVILILTILFFAFVISFGYVNRSTEEERNITESEFRMRRAFHTGRNAYYEGLLREYFEEQELLQPEKPELFP